MQVEEKATERSITMLLVWMLVLLRTVVVSNGGNDIWRSYGVGEEKGGELARGEQLLTGKGKLITKFYSESYQLNNR